MSVARKLQPRNHLGMANLPLLPQTGISCGRCTRSSRDRGARQEDFVFYSGRIIRLLVEVGLGLLPFEPCGRGARGQKVRRPALRLAALRRVSIARAGESMEAELRAVYQVGSHRQDPHPEGQDDEAPAPPLFVSPPRYRAVPRPAAGSDAGHRRGRRSPPSRSSWTEASRRRRSSSSTLITVLEGIAAVTERYPDVKVVASSIEEGLNENAYMMPGIGDFGDRYVGT